MGLLIFQRYVFLNTGLFQSSHFFGELDLVQKSYGRNTKVNLLSFETEQKAAYIPKGDSIILA